MRRRNKEEIKHIIYASRPFGFDDAVLKSILLSSRTNNAKSNVTGALICRSDLYLQILEGPEDAVDQTFQRIERDDRHLEIHPLKENFPYLLHVQILTHLVDSVGKAEK